MKKKDLLSMWEEFEDRINKIIDDIKNKDKYTKNELKDYHDMSLASKEALQGLLLMTQTHILERMDEEEQ